MKKGIVFLMIVTFNLTTSFAAGQSSYFNKYQTLADSLEKLYSIPSSIMLAIAYHESGGGNSRNAKLLNNHFGIVGPNNLKKTHNITSRYKQYSSVAESYFGFCKLISSKSFFAQLKGTTDIAKWVNSIASSGYAGSSKAWAEKIKWIIKNYGLK